MPHIGNDILLKIHRFLGAAATLAALLFAAGCTRNLRRVDDAPRAVAFPTAFPWASMVYAARTDAGVVVVDLGWNGARGALRENLRRIGATPQDVGHVFLTHSHRDHIGAWREVPHAVFHVPEAEAELFAGDARHGDLPSRAARLVLGDAAPWPGEVAVRPFSRDTAFVFGGDTLRAFVVPGHTPGSAAYLFRGVLFAGDAITFSRLRGFRPPFGIFTHDVPESRESLRELWDRLEPFDVRWVCTAHSKCAPADSALILKTTR